MPTLRRHVATPLSKRGALCLRREKPEHAAGYACRMTWLLRWFLLAAALLAVAHLSPGVQVASFGSALIAAAVLGLFNTLLRPLLVLLTLPVTLLTLGLFLFVINAALFWAAAAVLDGFVVQGFGAALLGSLIYSLLGLLIDLLLRKGD